ncbi:hypothetical protein GGR21_000496 [Dysgonomonas hofstadii]|uniref:Uncharacterized protein n=1 Tax=Dysgonomonas hofstadii TaxID=637886 RepID=A0A840CIW3_9BACT|nr:hypothetical protein [Dysgonomonas hofstadii]
MDNREVILKQAFVNFYFKKQREKNGDRQWK